MYSRWFSTAVVLLWLSTMGWLVKEKVLPPLLLGDPPSNQTILQARRGHPPVRWQILWNNNEVGWATNSTKELPKGCTRIDSHVHFDDLPVDEMAPGWLRAIFHVVERVGGSADDDKGNAIHDIQTDAVSSFIIDASNRLSEIESSLSFQPSGQTISMQGVAKDDKLELTVHSFDVDLKAQVPLDTDAFLRDALSPTTRLPNLYEGRTWTVSVLTPLKYPNSPHEILLAKVEGLHLITYNGSPKAVWLVTYHNNPGKKLSTDTKPRAKLWVQRDGVVLKQEMSILNSTITFVRIPDNCNNE
ncbi:MAG: hypothetical protein JXM70_18340 [Pirellulales bacterium]|nr:hypothetical protein [Pirellulales bacterium]